MKIIHAQQNPQRAGHMDVRWDVFVTEQHVPMALEIDARDLRNDVLHLSAINENGHTIGAVRIIPDKDGHYHLGRLAVRRTSRGQGIGAALVAAAHQEIAALTPAGTRATITLDAQIHARTFYETLGYHATSETPFIDAGIEHIEMATVLEGQATG